MAQPLKVFILAVLCAILFRKKQNPCDLNEEKSIRIERLDKSENDLLTTFENSFSNLNNNEVNSFNQNEIQQNRIERLKQIKTKLIIREIFIYLLFLFLLYSLTYTSRESNSFLYQRSLKNLFVNKKLDLVKKINYKFLLKIKD